MITLVPGFNIIIGGQWGSEGKGKVAGVLAEQASAVVTDCMPNAGHTFYDEGVKYVSKCIPVAASLRDIPVFIGPGAVLNRVSFFREMERVKGPVRIHPNTAVVQANDLVAEEALVKTIASTGQGGGAALTHKIQRVGITVASCHSELREFVCPADVWMEELGSCLDRPVLVETGQGFDLSIDRRWYPHCTSRNINVPAILDRIGGWRERDVAKVIGVIRTYPIRVGHVRSKEGDIIGDSGGCYSDHQELTWDGLDLQPEITTVTGRVRRVFGFSWEQFRAFLWMCKPDHLVVNFIDYLTTDETSDFCTKIGMQYTGYVSYSDNSRTLTDKGRRRWLSV